MSTQVTPEIPSLGVAWAHPGTATVTAQTIAREYTLHGALHAHGRYRLHDTAAGQLVHSMHPSSGGRSTAAPLLHP